MRETITHWSPIRRRFSERQHPNWGEHRHTNFSLQTTIAMLAPFDPIELKKWRKQQRGRNAHHKFGPTIKMRPVPPLSLTTYFFPSHSRKKKLRQKSY